MIPPTDGGWGRAEGEMFGFPRLRALITEHGEERALTLYDVG